MLQDRGLFGASYAPIVIAIIGCFMFDYTNDVFWPPWAWLMLLVTTCLGVRLVTAGSVPYSAGALWAWITQNALLWADWRPLTAGMDLNDKAAIRAVSAQTGLEWVLLTGFFYTQWDRVRKPLAWGLYFGGMLHAGFLIFDQVAPKIWPELPQVLFATKGLLGNRSIGASFTAVWFFFCLHWLFEVGKARSKVPLAHFWTVGVLTFASIAVSVSSISFAALAAGIGAVAFLWLFTLIGWIEAVSVITTIAVIAVLLGKFIDPEWGHHISRQDAWPMFFQFFKENGFLTFGSGAGTFKFYGPLIQEHHDYMIGRWWLWAHNDWLQIWFEYGLVGLALAIALFCSLLWKVRSKPLLFGAGVSYAVVMAGNYPLHVAIPALLGMWLVFEAMWGEREKSG